MTSDLPPTEDQPPPDQSAAFSTSASTPSTPSTSPSNSSRHPFDEIFDRIRSLGVVRPDEGRWGAGVAAGLGRRWSIDPVLVRGIFVALSIVGGLGVAAYGLCWLLLPQQDGRIHLQQAIRGDFSAGFVGAALLSLALLGGGGGPGPWHDGLWFNWGFPGGLVLTIVVVGGIWWLARNGKLAGPPMAAGSASTATGTAAAPAEFSTPAATYGTPAYGNPPYGNSPYGNGNPPYGSPASADPRPVAPATRSPRALARERSAPSKPIVRLTLGIAGLVASTTLLIGRDRDWSAPAGLIAAALALLVLAVGVIVSGLSGRRAPGLIGLGIILAIGTVAGAGANNVGIRSGQNLAVAGSQDWRPSTADGAGTQFNLGLGEATLWLTDPGILSGATVSDPLAVSARVGAGHLTVVLPDDVAARLKIQLGAGDVEYPNGTSKQINGGHRHQPLADVSTGPISAPRLIVNVQQGVGQLDIRTESQVANGSFPTSTSGPGSTPTPSATAKK